MSTYTNPKVNLVVYSGPTDAFTEQDWIDLALAALDQACLSLQAQRAVREVVEKEAA